jgi:hypothetical protein
MDKKILKKMDGRVVVNWFETYAGALMPAPVFAPILWSNLKIKNCLKWCPLQLLCRDCSNKELEFNGITM